jgi:hypothetical protein
MLKRSVTSLPKNISMLDILDDIDDISIENKITKKFICKLCDKILYNKNLYESHKDSCYQKKIDDLNQELFKYKNQKDDIIHDLRIKYAEYLIQKNNDKWNKLFKI